jgi:hypothetical protein
VTVTCAQATPGLAFTVDIQLYPAVVSMTMFPPPALTTTTVLASTMELSFCLWSSPHCHNPQGDVHLQWYEREANVFWIREDYIATLRNGRISMLLVGWWLQVTRQVLCNCEAGVMHWCSCEDKSLTYCPLQHSP